MPELLTEPEIVPKRRLSRREKAAKVLTHLKRTVRAMEHPGAKYKAVSVKIQAEELAEALTNLVDGD